MSEEQENTPVEAAAVVDPLDEVLQQTSEQALRIAHIDENVQGVARALTDLNDSMLSGFAEMRAASEAARGSAMQGGGVDESFKLGLAERLDHLEMKAAETASRQKLAFTLVLIQMVILVIVLAVSMGWITGKKQQPDFAFTPPATSPAPSNPTLSAPVNAPAAAPVVAPSPEPAAPAGKKAKTKGKHR